MDNHARRVRYVVQNTGLSTAGAEALVQGSYLDRSIDLKLKPGQRRRIARSAGKNAQNPNAWRGARPQQVIADEVPPPQTEFSARDMRFPSSAPRLDGRKLLKTIDRLLGKART